MKVLAEMTSTASLHIEVTNKADVAILTAIIFTADENKVTQTVKDYCDTTANLDSNTYTLEEFKEAMQTSTNNLLKAMEDYKKVQGGTGTRKRVMQDD